jgi:hypothetical protein
LNSSSDTLSTLSHGQRIRNHELFGSILSPMPEQHRINEIASHIRLPDSIIKQLWCRFRDSHSL